MNEFAQLREAAEAATPGPWRWWTSCSFNRLSSDATGKDGDVLRGVKYSDGICGVEGSEADMRFIELANPATILALLARLEAAERDARRYRWLRNHGDQFDDLPILDGRGRLVAEFLDTAIDAALATQEQP